MKIRLWITHRFWTTVASQESSLAGGSSLADLHHLLEGLEFLPVLAPVLGPVPARRKVRTFRRPPGGHGAWGPWRSPAGPPNHLDDKVDSDQWIFNKELSLSAIPHTYYPVHLGPTNWNFRCWLRPRALLRHRFTFG